MLREFIARTLTVEENGQPHLPPGFFRSYEVNDQGPEKTTNDMVRFLSAYSLHYESNSDTWDCDRVEGGATASEDLFMTYSRQD